jgi:hypothetical protein
MGPLQDGGRRTENAFTEDAQVTGSESGISMNNQYEEEEETKCTRNQ